jgi:hypothetical protein
VYKIEIERVANGFILKRKNDSTGKPEKVVFIEKDMEGDDLFMCRRLLWEVLESFGIYQNDNNQLSLKIKVIKNHKT